MILRLLSALKIMSYDPRAVFFFIIKGIKSIHTSWPL